MNKFRTGSEYEPLINEDPSPSRIVISFSKIAWFTVSMPFFAFAFCILYSVLYNFESATSTHCKVYNILPSVSAAIGHYKPQRDVWRAAIATQAVIRAIILSMYYHYYTNVVYNWAQGIKNFALISYGIENTALVTLSFWSSNENYAFHKLSFITFLIMALVHMSLAWYISKHCRASAKDHSETTSQRWKTRSLILNVASIFAACYFFWRHNAYCEPFVYSMFAMCEYMVVLSNMGFHVTAAWDFAGRSLMLSMHGIRII
ncbi:post-GPI attachment to proteins factor 2-like isoform X2 [Venturia canescens]|nr:post-GPI attachment to proteins factor 2-like isoform X2 [Venturia canescens]XP_043269864.1 post-GPI attachment to proteins factor 2-like isoform X2 [Venturia canescens]